MLDSINYTFNTARELISDAIRTPRRVLMMGAAGCGKTTLLYQLRLGIAITTIPTIGYNIETLAIQGREITIWDIGGDWSYRHGHWRHYISGADGIIFVVDSSDQLQINEAKVALRGFYREYEAQLKRSVLLVFANKQDRLDALSVAEVKDKLGLEAMQSEGRRWHIHGSIARSGDGLIDAMEWMSTQIR